MKRHLASWVLLAVFVPMVLLSSIHMHPSATADETECTQCIQHHCHGHLMPLTATMHACVLCQFITMSYVAAAVVLVAALSLLTSCLLPVGSLSAVCARPWGAVGTRGPPAVWAIRNK